MNAVIDRSAPGIRITLLADERAASGEPLELGGRVIGFTFEDSGARPTRSPSSSTTSTCRCSSGRI